MANRRIDVTLGINADTSAAKTQLQTLRTELNGLQSKALSVDDAGLKKAAESAKQLQVHLQNALNTNTGNIDLSKLDASLRKSKTNIQELGSGLLQAGAGGQQAFVKLAQSIANAEYPALRLSNTMKSFATTMMSTLKWQISSSILHGFIGSIQQAYGYAKDLNDSLNDIRIVTGYNIQTMDKFAESANKAAKNLSTSTLDYTKAALIYYQQGLGGKEIEERTNATIKMANVTGQAAQTVSDQMTAIWNNFDDGSKNLEYYADVVTALGAATASSSDEIAQGLEKFSAVAETVGLSYEYATSALATVTAETRQSADVVGTAFKTLFSRMQGLKLGETLDDGTTLNKYSESLLAVGINIKDSNGQLKEMDNILDEMGAKWSTLNKDQQVALAQTVGGIRQYNQLIALMDNWDTFKVNLEIAEGAEGTLEEQSKIYEESWAASSKRVRASMEELWNNMLNDDFFIELNDSLSGVVEGVSNLIENFGGIGNVIQTVAAIFIGVFANKIGPMLSDIKNTVITMFVGTGKQIQGISQQTQQMISDGMAKSKDMGLLGQQQLKNAQELIGARAKLALVSKNLNAQEKMKAESDLSNIEIQQREVEAIAEKVQKLREERELLLSKPTSMQDSGSEVIKRQRSVIAGQDTQMAGLDPFSTEYEVLANEQMRYQEATGRLNESLNQQVQKMSEVYVKAEAIRASNPGEAEMLEKQAVDALRESYTEYLNTAQTSSSKDDFQPMISSLQAFKSILKTIPGDTTELAKALDLALSADNFEDAQVGVELVKEALKKTKIEGKDLQKILEKLNPKQFKNLKNNIENAEVETKRLTKGQQALNNAYKAFKPEHVMSGIERLGKIAGIAGSMSMIISSVRSLGQALTDTDASPMERFSTILMSLSMLIPGVINSGKMLTEVFGQVGAIQTYLNTQEEKSIALKLAKNNVDQLDFDITKKEAVTEALLGEIKDENMKKEIAAHSVDIAKIALQAVRNKQTDEEVIKEQLLAAGLSSETAGRTASTIATWAQTAANQGLKASLGPLLLVILAIVAAVALLTAGIIGLIALINWLKKGDKIDTKGAEELAERAKATQELADANEELRESMSGLIDEHNELSKAGENTAETIENIKNGIPDLIKSYHDLAEAVKGELEDTGFDQISDKIEQLERELNEATLTGDFSEAEKLQDEIDATLTKANAKQQIIGANSAAVLAQAAIQEEGGGKYNSSTGELTRNVGEVDWGKVNKDVLNAQDILERNLGEAFKKSGGWNDGGKISLRTENANTFVEDYENLIKARNEMAKDPLARGTDIYREVNEMVNAGMDQYESLKEQVDIANQAAGEALAAEFDARTKNIKSLTEYNNYRKDFIETAQEEYELTEDQAKALFDQQEAIKGVSAKYDLATTYLEKFKHASMDDFSEEGQKEVLKAFEELTKGMSDTELTLAVNVMANSDSLEEFNEQMRHASIEAMRADYNTAAQTASSLLSNEDALESQSFSSDQLTKLTDNEAFKEFLEEQKKIRAEDFVLWNYDEQYSLITEFYSNSKKLVNDTYTYQEGLYYQDMAKYSNIMSQMADIDEKTRQEMLDKQAEYEQRKQDLEKAATDEEKRKIQAELDAMSSNYQITYGLDIELNEVDITNKIKQIGDEIDALNEKKIEIATSWDGIEKVEQNLENISGFASFMRKDAKKVGDSYELTAAQAREWAKVYPELFANAKVTNTGIMKLNAAETEDFLDKQETQSDASIEAEILSLEAQKESFLAKIEMREQDLLAAKALKEGEIQLENVSAEYLTDLRQNLTQKYLDMGFEETEANKKALETMGVNEEQYSALVADAAQINADNTINSVEIGAQAQAKEINWLQQKWTNFTNLLGDVAIAIGNALKGDWSGFKNLFKAKDTSTSSGGTTFTAQTLTSDSTFTAGEKTEVSTEDLLTQTSEELFAGITDDINKYKDTIANIDTQIAMLKAYQLQSLSDYGSDDVDDVKAGDGTGGDSGDDKEVEDLEIPEETVERYKEINDALEEAEHRTDKLSRAMDKAYGAEKIKKINEVNKSLAEEIGLLQARLEEESGYLVRDAASVMTQSVKLGDETHLMGFEVDETGKVTNYNAVMKAWNQKLAEATEHYNSLGTEEEREAYKKAVIEPIEKALEDSEEAVSKLDETRNQKKETETQIEDKKDEIKENKIEGIKYKVEVRMELSEEDREQIEKQIEALGEKIYTSEERVIKLMEKLPSLDADLKAIQEADQKLEEMYEGKEKDTAYYEAKKELRDQAKEVVEATEEMGEAIREAWINAFEGALEEIEKITNKWEGLNGQLEHYQNVLGLIGRENDFEAQNILLDGQMALAEDQLETSKATLDMYKAQRKEKQQELDDYKKGVAEGTKEQDQLWEDSLTANIEVIDEAIDETQSKIYESTEAYFEYAKKKWENLGEIAAKELSDALAGENYSSLEDLETAFDYIEKLNEGVLTKTNQLYETNKLIAQAQLNIDKTNNTVTKQKYNEYIKYIEQLKNATELSEFDLKVAQNKFEVLQAQIALEDAQNAKSTVRLTRDAEGNWGYTYSADNNKISEAEQKLADSENKLYNLGLDESKKSNSKQLQILKEYYDSANDLRSKFNSGEIKTKQEFDKKMQALEDNTKARLLRVNQTYYNARDLLAETSSSNLENNLFIDMINIEDFSIAVDKYTNDNETAWNEWGNTVKKVSDQAGLDFISFGDTISREVSEINLNLKGLRDETDNVKTASNELKVALIGEDGASGLVKALADELTAVSNVITKTGEHATKLGEVKTAAEAFVTYSTETLRPELDLLNKTDVDIDITINSNAATKVQETKDKLAEIPETITTYIETVRLPEGEKAPTDGKVPDGDGKVPDGDSDTDNTKRFTKKIDNTNVSYMGGGYLNLGDGKAIHFTDMQIYRNWKKGDPIPTPSELESDFDAQAQWVDPDKIKNFVGWDDTLNKNLINPTLIAYGTGEEGSGNGQFTIYDGKRDEIVYNVEKVQSGTVRPLYQVNGKYYESSDLKYTGRLEQGAKVQIKASAEPDKFDEPSLKGLNGGNKLGVYSLTPGSYLNQNGEKMEIDGYENIDLDKTDINNAKIIGVKIDKNGNSYYKISPEIYTKKGKRMVWIDSNILSSIVLKFNTETLDSNYNLKKDFTNFDTGGYTGQWGSEGKLAMLHEKEIVLNKYDTANFLQAIEFIRPIAGVIDNLAKTMSLGKLGFGKIDLGQTKDQILQQEVHIQAEFPNVQDHNEIELAIENLVNTASQYANRKI